MATPCTNEKPCLQTAAGGAHSQVCRKLVAQGARPTRPPPRALQPAKLSPPELEVAKGDGRVGCACGEAILANRKAPWRDPETGTVHRHGLPCLPAKAPAASTPRAQVPERAGREGDQALPDAGGESVFAEVRRRIDEREAIGIRRYGRSLETFNGRDAGRDLEDELLDGLNYATQLRMERSALAEAVKVLAKYHRDGQTSPAFLAALDLADRLKRARG